MGDIPKVQGWTQPQPRPGPLILRMLHSRVLPYILTSSLLTKTASGKQGEHGQLKEDRTYKWGAPSCASPNFWWSCEVLGRRWTRPECLSPALDPQGVLVASLAAKTLLDIYAGSMFFPEPSGLWRGCGRISTSTCDRDLACSDRYPDTVDALNSTSASQCAPNIIP